MILALSGSLRAGSMNGAVLEAARLLDARVELYMELGALPHFNPDLDGDALPEMVRRLRETVGRADALLLCVPEYAHGVPGSFKNLLDWLVASTELPGKRVLMINASPRSRHAHDQLVEILSTMSVQLVPTVTTPQLERGATATQLVENPDVRATLEEALRRLQ